MSHDPFCSVTSLIADPDLPYADVAGRLRALGWEWLRESQHLPILPGEPEWVIWSAAEPPARLIYTFHPAVRLRVLAFSGTGAEAQCRRTAAALPHLTSADIRDRLTSTVEGDALLGLLATEELGLLALLPAVVALCGSEDDFVAEVAVRVAGTLQRQVAAFARQVLDGPSPTSRLQAFASSVAPAIRRQVVRTAGRDLQREEELALLVLLRAGFADPDWEVRASALLWTGRRGLGALAEAAGSARLPDTDTVSRDDQRRLSLLRAVVLDHLRGQAPRDPEGRHALHCVLQQEDGVFDDLRLLVHSLTEPLQLDGPPERQPAAVVQDVIGPVLTRSGLPLCWVAPVPCWLGETEASASVRNPLRRVVPRNGFFLARRPLSRTQVAWLLAGAEGKAPDGLREPGQLCTHEEALRVAAALATLEGAPVALPTPDQWEMAARGSDGRRHPWGNGWEPEPARRLSPWGLEAMGSGCPEWTRPLEGEAVVCGGPALTCASRSRPEGPAFVRPLLPGPS